MLQVEGDVYISSPSGFRHAVEYPQSTWQEGDVVDGGIVSARKAGWCVWLEVEGRWEVGCWILSVPTNRAGDSNAMSILDDSRVIGNDDVYRWKQSGPVRCDLSSARSRRSKFEGFHTFFSKNNKFEGCDADIGASAGDWERIETPISTDKKHWREKELFCLVSRSVVYVNKREMVLKRICILILWHRKGKKSKEKGGSLFSTPADLTAKESIHLSEKKLLRKDDNGCSRERQQGRQGQKEEGQARGGDGVFPFFRRFWEKFSGMLWFFSQSEEDIAKKAELDLLVTQVLEGDAGLSKIALETIRSGCKRIMGVSFFLKNRNEIRTSTSSMTSVPKPLKFLRPHYDSIKGCFEAAPAGELKVFCLHFGDFSLSFDFFFQMLIADILSVLGMTMAAEGTRESLKYKLQGSPGHIDAWGHEFVRFRWNCKFFCHFTTGIWLEKSAKSGKREPKKSWMWTIC